MTQPPTPSEDQLARLLPADVPADPTRQRHPAELDAWYGHVWSRLGRGDYAWAWWDRGDEAEVLRPWVHAERGRVLRELGLYAEAERHDAAGLAIAMDPVDIVMLRLGLTADAVGRGDAEAARLRFQSASPLLDALHDGPRVARQRLRRSWVAVEVAMVTGDEVPVDGLPDWRSGEGVIWPEDYEAGTDFHRAKGLLFAGVARKDAELLDAAAELAPVGMRWAVELARADRGDDEALQRARDAWARMVMPPGTAEGVGATPTAKRLAPPVEPTPG